MKNSRRIICMALIVVTMALMLLPITASAATKTVTVNVRQNWGATITVKTQNATTISFTQTKGKLFYTYLTGSSASFNTYGCYKITVKDKSTNSSTTYYVNGGSKSISLKANRTYTITVCANTRSYVYTHVHNSFWWSTHQASYAGGASDLSWNPMTNWKVVIKNVKSGSYSLFAAPNQ